MTSLLNSRTCRVEIVSFGAPHRECAHDAGGPLLKQSQILAMEFCIIKYGFEDYRRGPGPLSASSAAPTRRIRDS
jgi:hypothetical protein